MPRVIKVISILLGCFVLLTFGIFLANQTQQIVALIGAANPTAGRVTLWALVCLYAVLVLVPVYLWLRMPARLVPPEDENSPEFERHLQVLSRTLSKNPRLKYQDVALTTRADIEAAIRQLDRETNDVVTRTASAVFLATAVSQSGRLDMLMVLATQIRMVWQVAHIYYQRPSVREMLNLYANVAATSFIASELDDIQVEPLIAPVLGATVGAIPGLQQVTAVVVRSALAGAANAFLTLRVGMITKRYCSALVARDKRLLRRSATAEAARLLGGIVSDGVRRMSKGIWGASRSGVRRVFGRVKIETEEAREF